MVIDCPFEFKIGKELPGPQYDRDDHTLYSRQISSKNAIVSSNDLG